MAIREIRVVPDPVLRTACDPVRTITPAVRRLVRDLLDDPMEQKFFLERYNRQFAEENDTEWLKKLINTEGFERILIVSPTGMAAARRCRYCAGYRLQ